MKRWVLLLPKCGSTIIYRGESNQVGKEYHRKQNLGQRQDILWRTVPISHTVLTLHSRQGSQVRPCQQHQIWRIRERKGRKLRGCDVCHDVLATPRASKKMKKSKKQALKMAQQSIIQMAEKMTAMYNIVSTTENIMTTPTRRRDASAKANKSQCTPKASKANASKGTILKTLHAAGTPFWKGLFWPQR